MRRRGWAAVAAAAVTGFATASPALAVNVHGPKVDDRVAFAADSSSATTAIPVIVFGKQIGAKKNPELSIKKQLYGQAVAGTITANQLDRLAGDANIAYVAPDTAVAPLATTTTSTSTPVPMSFPDLLTLYPSVDGAPQAWAQGYTGAGVGVAVIDSGTINDDFGSPSRLKVSTGANRGDDAYGHGMLVSHVAAGCCAGGSYVGIAPAATVLSYNVATPSGTYTSDVIEALIWVAVNQSKYNIRVVNLSLGETTPSSAQQSALDTVVEILQQYCHVLVVTSAGNLGPDSVEFAPGNDPFALTVGATDVNGTADPSDDALTPWSSYGTTLDGYAKPELVAPGRLIMSELTPTTLLGAQAPAENWAPRHSYAEISGTSFSAPQVAGAAAVLFQEHPDWTPGQVKWVLANTARPVAGSGAGSLDLAAATNYAGTPPDANARLQPSQFGLPSWVQSILNGNSWNGNSWNANSWNGNSWNASSWKANSWNVSAWTGNSWNANSWNDHGWDRP